MSSASSAPEVSFTLAKVGTNYFKFAPDAPLPEGAQTMTLDDLSKSSKEELEEMYASVAGTSPKKFKSQEMALENVTFQVGKMKLIAAAAATGPLPATVDPTERKYAKKAPSTYKLMLDAGSSDKIKNLGPQARECINVMADFAKQEGRLEFKEDELKVFFDACKDRLKTKQEPWRILMYYRGKLISADLLRVS